jgi:hypothetical protein
MVLKLVASPVPLWRQGFSVELSLLPDKSASLIAYRNRITSLPMKILLVARANERSKHWGEGHDQTAGRVLISIPPLIALTDGEIAQS